mmetsp:Transcript_14024/g.29621  ORF Transcript_14024/g.29621 Transcript_14024/m.29621 type:complete len:156 (-) Transcript_14024:461-928(-)
MSLSIGRSNNGAFWTAVAAVTVAVALSAVRVMGNSAKRNDRKSQRKNNSEGSDNSNDNSGGGSDSDEPSSSAATIATSPTTTSSSSTLSTSPRPGTPQTTPTPTPTRTPGTATTRKRGSPKGMRGIGTNHSSTAKRGQLVAAANLSQVPKLPSRD